MAAANSNPRLNPSILVIGAAIAMGAGITGCLAFRSRPAAPAAIPAIRTFGSAETAGFAGSEACAKCHSKEATTHAHSNHARALTAVTASSDGERFHAPSSLVDPERGIKLKTTVSGDKCVLVAEQGQASQMAVATWGFGSGKHAVTYHGELPNGPVELRLSYYSAAKRWDFSPGQQLRTPMSGGVLYPAGLQKSPDTVDECFTCHATRVVKDPGGHVQPQLLQPGVQCEACHGAGRAHIQAVQNGDKDLHIARLGQVRSRISTELCGQCHRSPAGDSLTEPYNIQQMPRFQGLALSQSACFKSSGGQLNCLSCHDPHADDRDLHLDYSKVCRSCHSDQTTQRICSIEPKGNCIPCHMPAQDVGMPTGLRYRNHWIKIWSVNEQERRAASPASPNS